MLEQVLLTLSDEKALRQICSAAKFRADRPLVPVDEETEPEEKIPKAPIRSCTTLAGSCPGGGR